MNTRSFFLMVGMFAGFVVSGGCGSSDPFEIRIAECTEEIEDDPESPLPYLIRGQVWFEGGQYEEVQADFDKHLRLDPNSAKGYLYRALCWNAKNEPRRAMVEELIGSDLVFRF